MTPGNVFLPETICLRPGVGFFSCFENPGKERFPEDFSKLLSRDFSTLGKSPQLFEKTEKTEKSKN